MKQIIIFTELFVNILFNLLSTILHEFSHAIVAILTMSKIKSIDITPRITVMDDYINIVYGSVVTTPRFLGLNVFVALAPFLLFAPLYYILYTNSILEVFYIKGSFALTFNVGNFLQLTLLEQFFIVQLFLGAFPSCIDYRVALNSMFSRGFFMLILILLGVSYWKF